MVSAHVLYSGRVQGVGFRFTTQSIASSLKLTGWVKNLRDGRVEVVAEGQKIQVQELCRQLKDHFGQSIQDEQINFSSYSGKYKEFKVEY